jgi:competence protein ComEC
MSVCYTFFMRTKTLVVLVSCFTLGVVFRSFIDLGQTFALFVILISGALLLLPRVRPMVSRTSFIVSLCILAAGSGILRTDLAYMDDGRHVLDNMVGEYISLEGMVSKEPDVREAVTRLTVDVTFPTLHETRTGVILSVPHYPQYTYGDVIVFEGVLEKPENVASENGREFDYRGYLAQQGVFYEMYRPQTQKVGEHAGNIVVGSLLDLKQAFLQRVSQSLHEPYAALVGGLVVGAKQSLGADLLDKFRVTGLIHIVVLSGYNVTIIAYALIRLVGFLPPLWRAAVGVVSIALFAIMTGAGATIVRASIMAALVVVAKAIGRDVDIMRLLAIAAFFMVMHNPHIVVFDPSFQLSFLATLGLVLVSPLFEKYIMWVPEKYALREVVAATVSTQIFVLPALIYMMGEVSLVALPVNLLVLIVIPITMLLGFLTGVFGFIHPALAMFPAFFAFVFLYYEIAVVELFSALPFASVSVPHVSLFFIIVWYMLYAIILWRWYNARHET